MTDHSDPSVAGAPARPELLTRFSRLIGRIIPDALSTSVIMMLLVLIVALAMGSSFSAAIDAYYRGLWMLLPFTMQMTLILVLSSALGASPVFNRIVRAISRVPRTASQVLALASVVTAVLSYVYWGLGLTLGPLVAVYFAREAEQRKISVDFPFLLATTMAATSVWQYGLSSTAPLMMATAGHFLEKTTGLMPLSTTIFAPASILYVVSFLIGAILLARAIQPRNPEPLSRFPDAYRLADPIKAAEAEPIAQRSPMTPSERIEGSWFATGTLCIALIGWLVYHFTVKKASLDLNSLNTSLLLLCLLFHRNVKNFSRALQSAIVSCWPVVVLYHLYAGVAGLIQFTPVGERFASAFASVSGRYTFPLLTALASTVVAIFVPSSGGQWVIQGFVTTKAAEAVGVTTQRGLLSLGVGDQMGNLLSPFWAVIASGIARIDFRRFIGYGMVYSALWFVLGVLIFTFLPA